MFSALPTKPNLRHLKQQAEDLPKSFQAGDTSVCAQYAPDPPAFARG